MASLGELYTLLDAQIEAGNNVNELLALIQQKECEVLSQEITPSIEEIVNILLQNFRSDVKITISHPKGGNSMVKVEKSSCITKRPQNTIEEQPTPHSSTYNASQKLYAKNQNGVFAKGLFNPINKNFTILAGSIICSKPSNSYRDINNFYKITASYCKPVVEGLTKLMKSITFPSPSAASSFVFGRSSNGWIDWKNANGITLNELVRQS